MSTLDNLGKRLDRVQIKIVPPAPTYATIFFQARRYEPPYPSIEEALQETLEEQEDVRSEHERLRAQGVTTFLWLPRKDELRV